MTQIADGGGQRETENGAGAGAPPKAEPSSVAADAPGGEAAPPSVVPDSEGPSTERAKKERVLHTRVPAVLEQELKRFADNLRIPVSNLVRTILEDAVAVADAATGNVEERLKSAAHKLEEERERLKKKVRFDPLRDVFAFQTMTLAQPAECAKCHQPLGPGRRAHMGLTDDPAPRGRSKIFVCDDCLPKA